MSHRYDVLFQGDSGGPLWVEGKQVGIVSWSEHPRTIQPYPGVFTEISKYTNWIISHTTTEGDVARDEL